MRLELDGAVATVTLIRFDKRNAQTPELWAALATIGETLPADIRVVVLRAEGPSFSAGLDRALLAPQSPDDLFPTIATAADETALAIIADFQRAFSWWRRPSLVSIAVVQGHAVGAGFQLALATDLRVLADDVQFAMREPSLGLVPDLGGTQPLVQAVGYSRALEICLTGRWIGAEEAYALGLGNVVVPRAELDSATSDLVAALLAVPSGAAAATKALLASAESRTYEDQLLAERTAQLGRLRALLSATDTR
ncbi:enoyl-CoA hydratase/isomerase family protein [Tenggerimyces flavus]|uniref:Enoyl-CoA hydratase/isomerase family protein n=1 Tax=Tenggerimyces flavus TaxID=1708749 RepID=A0ABV7YKR9_9ACTN|nr:enoyl-CoA hydratase/isomerase family protein [Tenggerimyces flavus]MBM7787361.1 enoyl-CoA hydratase/carnithine racemase [Tenggerimyces flavus]